MDEIVNEVNVPLTGFLVLSTGVYTYVQLFILDFDAKFYFGVFYEIY